MILHGKNDVLAHAVFIGMLQDLFGWLPEQPLFVFLLFVRQLFVYFEVQFFIGHCQRSSLV